jgi:hypothetical protein
VTGPELALVAGVLGFGAGWALGYHRGRRHEQRARSRALRIAATLLAVGTIAAGCAAPPPTATCHEAVDAIWPASSRAWAHRIVQRESRGRAWAQNKRSSAAGCFQLLRMHAWRFDETGSSWAHRYEAPANTRAALHLYQQAGRRPWR